ncbi:MAG: DUF4131 domain-containing protein, partial [Pseudoflavonifractor sp.]
MRKLASFALPFALAVFGAVYLLPQALWLPAAVFCGLAGLWYFLLRRGRGDSALRVVLIALGLAAGLLWSFGYDMLFLTPAQNLDGKSALVSATVVDWPEQNSYGTTLTLRVQVQGAPDVKTWLKLRGDYMDLRPGDRLRFEGQFRLADNMGGEDSHYFFSQGIFLLCSAGDIGEIIPPEGIPLRFLPQYISRALQSSIASCFPADVTGFMTALLTGEKGALDPALYGAMQRTGIAHV